MRSPSPSLIGLAILPAAAIACSPIQGRLYPAPTRPLVAQALPAGASLVTVITRDGLAITGAEITGRLDRPVLLVFHGNASSAATTLRWLQPLVDRGYGIVAAEYRGYSANPGRPDEAGLAADADAFYAEAQRLAGNRRVEVIGHSLGGGVAFGLAMRARLSALITIGTFGRLRTLTPWVARPFVADRYDNLADVGKLDEPLFLIHGGADETVPVAEERKLETAAAAAHRSGGWFLIRGAAHHPDARTIAAIVERIDRRLSGAQAPAPPAGVIEGQFVR